MDVVINQPSWAERVAVLQNQADNILLVMVLALVVCIIGAVWMRLSIWAQRSAHVFMPDPSLMSLLTTVLSGFALVVLIFGLLVTRGEISDARVHARFGSPAGGVVLYEGGKVGK